jgi:hypothetical protein
MSKIDPLARELRERVMGAVDEDLELLLQLV